MNRRSRVGMAASGVATAALLAALLAGCGVSVAVGALPRPSGPASSVTPAPSTTMPTTAPTTAPTTKAPPTGVTAAAASCDQDLTGCLAPRPPGAVAWANPNLGDGDTTVGKFVGWVYGNSKASDRSSETSRLSTAGVVEVSHRDWYVNGHGQANIYLVRFSTSDEAASDLSVIEDSAANSSAEHTLALPGVADTTSSYAYDSASDGYMEGKSYAQLGDVVMEFFFFSPKTLDDATMAGWVNSQLSALRR